MRATVTPISTVFLCLVLATYITLGNSCSSSSSSPDGNTAAVDTVVPAWPPATKEQFPTYHDLHQEYNSIFQYGNRNAASHLWSTFLLQRSNQMDFARLRYFFSSFCVVSGSPVRPTDYNKYQMTLPMVNKSITNDNNGNDNGTTNNNNNNNDTNSIIDNNNNNTNYFTGYLHYCCWPCVCDTEDFIHVDTLTIGSKSRSKTVTGNTTITTIQKQQRYFAVIGNPCDHPEKLTEPFVEIFGRYSTTLSETAKEVRCSEDGVLLGATYSDHGYIILGMMLQQDDDNDNDGYDNDDGDSDDDDNSNNNNKDDALLVFDGNPTPGRITKNAHTNIQYHDQREYGPKCLDRAQQGYNSGMGEIFRKVCAITPIKSSLSQLEEPVLVTEKQEEQDDNTTTSTFAIISTPHHDEKPQNDEL